jgi:hypothetical protein
MRRWRCGAIATAGGLGLIPSPRGERRGYVRRTRLANLAHAWVDKHRRVALTFGHAKVTITFAPATYSNALTEFEQVIEHNNVTAAIAHVHQRHGWPPLSWPRCPGR